MATVEVTPGGVVLVAGAWIRLHAEARDADGRLVTGNQVTWSSSNAEIADVLPTGFVIARGDGEASISATVAGKRGSARISVVQGPLEPPDDDGHDRVLR